MVTLLELVFTDEVVTTKMKNIRVFNINVQTLIDGCKNGEPFRLLKSIVSAREL
jgi:hypothetical protein